jgi:hypothetical protein
MAVINGKTADTSSLASVLTFIAPQGLIEEFQIMTNLRNPTYLNAHTSYHFAKGSVQ